MDPTLQTLRLWEEAEQSCSLGSSPGTELVLANPKIRHCCFFFYPCSSSKSHAAFHFITQWLTPDSLKMTGVGGWFRCIGWQKGGGKGRPLCTGELRSQAREGLSQDTSPVSPLPCPSIHVRITPMSECNCSMFKWLQLPGGAHLYEEGTYIFVYTSL